MNYLEIIAQAAEDYIKLRDKQAERLGLQTDHRSVEGQVLNRAVKDYQAWKFSVSKN